MKLLINDPIYSLPLSRFYGSIMNYFNTLSGDSMFHTKDHKTGYLFDGGPFGWLGPKRKRLIEKSWAKLFRETILPNLPVGALMKYYHLSHGAPTKELYAMMGVMVLQQMFDCTDEETVTQYAFNIQWHYALDITGETDTAAYISLKTLWNMRDILSANDLYATLFENSAGTLAKAFSIDASLQRIDSVHIFSNMRHLGRIRLFVKTIKKFLLNLKRHHREIFSFLEKERTDRYLLKKEESVFSMVKPSESTKTLQSLGDDLFFFIEQYKENTDITSMSSYKLLLRLLKEQCIMEENARVSIKPNRDVPSDSLQNPSDPDATYDGHKGKGYQVQIMETYAPDKKGFSLITHVAVEKAHISDANALIPAIEETEKRDLKPEEVLADSLYGSDDNTEKAKELGVDVVSPVMGKESAKQITLIDFTLSGTRVTACPEGHAPIFTKHKKDRYIAAFGTEICAACSQKNECPVRPGERGNYLRYDEKAIRIAQRRAYEKTPEFREKYRFRSGIEGTISCCDRKTGIKHLRVRDLKAVSFCATLKAIGINIFRAAAFKNRGNSAVNTGKGMDSPILNWLWGTLARYSFRMTARLTAKLYRDDPEPEFLPAMAA
jgi:hypothetical protein